MVRCARRKQLHIEKAIISDNVRIKDYSEVTPGCLIAAGVTLGPHARLPPRTRIARWSENIELAMSNLNIGSVDTPTEFLNEIAEQAAHVLGSYPMVSSGGTFPIQMKRRTFVGGRMILCWRQSIRMPSQLEVTWIFPTMMTSRPRLPLMPLLSRTRIRIFRRKSRASPRFSIVRQLISFSNRWRILSPLIILDWRSMV